MAPGDDDSENAFGLGGARGVTRDVKSMASKRNLYIAVAGVMGSGKTTACRLLARELGIRLFEEKAEENRFLPLFYEDPRRWAFALQLFCLAEKIGQLEEIKNALTHTVIGCFGLPRTSEA